jgi:GNAT superfamily N-acetyltransferase
LALYGGLVKIRPMVPEDVPAAERLTDDAFYEVGLRMATRGRPEPRRRPQANSAGWIRRTTRFLDTDADGCWVATDDSGLVGFATSIVRERLWILSTFIVRPGRQGQGIGHQLLARAQAHGAHADRGMLAATDDAMALRRYHVAGFALHPQMVFEGKVDRSAIPAVIGLREGTPDDRDWMDALDRELRGAPHGPDHVTLADAGRRLVVTAERTGYAYTSGGGTYLLAARDEATARLLLWECLASGDGDGDGKGEGEGDFVVSHVTSANIWAADVALRARLAMRTKGYLGVRDMTPPAPYIHSGPLL